MDLKTILACVLMWPASPVQPGTGTEGAAPRDTSFTATSAYIKESRKYPFIRIVKPRHPKGVKVDTSVVYAAYGERTLCMDVFYPAAGGDGTGIEKSRRRSAKAFGRRPVARRIVSDKAGPLEGGLAFVLRGSENPVHPVRQQLPAAFSRGPERNDRKAEEVRNPL
jgi:hypothetical protein